MLGFRVLAAVPLLTAGCGGSPEPSDTGGPISFAQLGTPECVVAGCPFDESMAVGTRTTVLVDGLTPNVSHWVESSAPDVIQVHADGVLIASPLACLVPACQAEPRFEATALAEGTSEIRVINAHGVRARLGLQARATTGVALRVWQQLPDGNEVRIMPEGGGTSDPFVLEVGANTTLTWDLLDKQGEALAGFGDVSMASSDDAVLRVSGVAGLSYWAEAVGPGRAELSVTTPGPTAVFPFEVHDRN